MRHSTFLVAALSLLSGCANTVELPFADERVQSAFDRPTEFGRSGYDFERRFLAGSLISRVLFLGGLPFEALRLANDMENRIVNEGLAERKIWHDDPSGEQQARFERRQERLIDPDPAVRMEVLSQISLEEAAARRHYERVLLLLDDPNDQVRMMAMKALEDDWRPTSFGVLAGRLSDPSLFNRMEAARQIQRFDADLAVPTLLRAVAQEAEGMVRMRLVESLATYAEDSRVLPSLVELLADEDRVVRHAAFGALVERTGLDHGYDPFGDPAARAESIVRWRGWIREGR